MNLQSTGGRTVVLDTETTGLDPKEGHRIIEIGCVEMRGRRLTGNNLHEYLQPDRQVDAGAIDVHGITNEFLEGKPRFPEKADQLLEYLRGAELVIHNAPFDVGFLEHEFALCGRDVKLSEICIVTDSLKMARDRYPGQRNSLDALCKRLDVNNTKRTLHGALLDSEILSDVYLRMTGGQTALGLEQEVSSDQGSAVVTMTVTDQPLTVVRASDEELAAHNDWVERLRGSDAGCAWDRHLPEAEPSLN